MMYRDNFDGELNSLRALKEIVCNKFWKNENVVSYFISRDKLIIDDIFIILKKMFKISEKYLFEANEESIESLVFGNFFEKESCEDIIVIRSFFLKINKSRFSILKKAISDSGKKIIILVEGESATSIGSFIFGVNFNSFSAQKVSNLNYIWALEQDESNHRLVDRKLLKSIAYKSKSRVQILKFLDECILELNQYNTSVYKSKNMKDFFPCIKKNYSHFVSLLSILRFSYEKFCKILKSLLIENMHNFKLQKNQDVKIASLLIEAEKLNKRQ